MPQRLVLIQPLAPAAMPKTEIPPPPPGGTPPGQTTPPPAPAATPLPYFAMVTFLEGGFTPSGPVDPGFGVEVPVDPGFGIPVRPPHVGNRPPWAPARPDHGLPGGPVIDNTLPIPTPPVDPDAPPGTIWPPLEPEHPGKPPEGIMPGYILVWVPGHGYKWVKVGNGKPEGPKPPKPPETAQPKR